MPTTATARFPRRAAVYRAQSRAPSPLPVLATAPRSRSYDRSFVELGTKRALEIRVGVVPRCRLFVGVPDAVDGLFGKGPRGDLQGQRQARAESHRQRQRGYVGSAER